MNSRVSWSSILTEIFSEFLILSQLFLVNRRFCPLEGSIKIQTRYEANIQLCLVLEISPGFRLSIFAFSAWSPFATLKLSEFSGQLKSSYRFINSVSDKNADITSTELICSMSKILKILLGNIVMIVSHSSLEHSQSKWIKMYLASYSGREMYILL